MSDLTLEVQHDRETVMALARVQYDATHEIHKLVLVLTAFFSLLIGVRLLPVVPEPVNWFFTIYACAVIAFMDMPPKITGEEICRRFDAMGKGYPCTIFDFENTRMHVTAKGDDGPGEYYEYKHCQRLVEYREDLYYFIRKDAAFIFPKKAIRPGQAESFKQYLEKHTGLQFGYMNRWWNISLWTMIRSQKGKR